MSIMNNVYQHRLSMSTHCQMNCRYKTCIDILLDTTDSFLLTIESIVSIKDFRYCLSSSFLNVFMICSANVYLC